MKKLIGVLLIVFLFSFFPVEKTFGQTQYRGWTLGVGMGYMNYFGDVSPYQIKGLSDWGKLLHFFDYNIYYQSKPAWGISLEKRFTSGMGFLLQADAGTISMSDRFKKNDGIYKSDAPNWDRALNFKSDLLDLGLAVSFYSDNGRLLKTDAFLSPYLFAGAGLTHFKVKGDLYDEKGQPYDYSNPAVVPDGTYETELRPLLTETDKKYADLTGFVNAGIGLKFRFSPVVGLALQTNVKYAFSDYLDDVSGRYKASYSSEEQAYAARPGINPPVGKRGNDDGVNDFYIFNKAALQFNIGAGKRRNHFTAPIIYNPELRIFEEKTGENSPYKIAENQGEMRDSPEKEEIPTSADSLRQLMAEMRRGISFLKAQSLEQSYLLRLSEVSRQIGFLEEVRIHSFDGKDWTTEDSLKAVSLDRKIDSLKSLYNALIREREDRLSAADSLLLFSESFYITDSSWGFPETQKYLGDSLTLFWAERDRNTELNIENDSLTSVIESLYREINVLRQGQVPGQGFGQEERIAQASLQPALDQDSLAEEQTRLQRAFRDSLVLEREEIRNMLRKGREKMRADSLEARKLEIRIDSIQRERDSLSAVLFEQPRQRNVFQRVFNKKPEETKEGDALMDRITEQQAELEEQRNQLSGLNTQIGNVRANNARYVQELEMIQRRSLNPPDLVSGYYSQGEIRPGLTVAPVVSPNLTGDNGDRDRRLAAIEEKLDQLTRQGGDSAQIRSEVIPRDTLFIPPSLEGWSFTAPTDQEGVRLMNETLILRLFDRMESLNQKISVLEEERRIRAEKSLEKEPPGPALDVSSFPAVNTYFELGSSTLNENQITKLRPLANSLSHAPDLFLLLKGYTDATGSRTVNERVASERLEAVKRILVDRFGVSPERIRTDTQIEIGKGRGSNALDRKVEVRLVR